MLYFSECVADSLSPLQGQRVRIVLHNGAEFEGIYNNGPDPTSCRLTMVQQKKLPNSSDAANGPNRREQSTMTFQRKDIAEARVVPGNVNKSDGRATNGTRSLWWILLINRWTDDFVFLGNRNSFRPDSAIANPRFGNERQLKPWVPEGGFPSDLDAPLEKSTSSGHWDQFAENERLFGIKTDYDENIYTTAIDKNHPQYKERLAAAEKKAREIERSAPVTAHHAEERIMDYVGGDDHDEEAK